MAGDQFCFSRDGRLAELDMGLAELVAVTRRAIRAFDLAVVDADHDDAAVRVCESDLDVGELARGDPERLAVEPLILGDRVESSARPWPPGLCRARPTSRVEDIYWKTLSVSRARMVRWPRIDGLTDMIAHDLGAFVDPGTSPPSKSTGT